MKILLACGGSGGHIFPAFSVAEELKSRHRDIRLVYVCGKKDIENAIFKMLDGERILPIDSAPFRGAGSIIHPGILIKWTLGFFQSVSILSREKPDLVVGFGGYAAFPLVSAAFCLGVKTLIHEQNVIPGLANRVLARFSSGTAVSFVETISYLPKLKNLRMTGNPIRSAIENGSREEALQFFNFSEDKVTLLVLGGSQGSESLNQFFVGLVRHLPREIRTRLQVLHLCGRMPTEQAEQALKESGIAGKAYSFFDRMDLVYAISDLAIGRAGATFLAEIAAKKIPAILIPYPYGNGHQHLNANAFRNCHEAVIIEQKNLTMEKLKEEVLKRIQKKPPSGPASNSRKFLADFIETLTK